MKEYIKDICENIDKDLKQIANTSSNILTRSEQSIICINEYLKKLKGHIRQYEFHTIEEEITFFKNDKPLVYSKLIYFVKIFQIELRRPKGSNKSQKKYLLNEVKKIENFLSENWKLCQYLRKNMDYLDDKYFVRGKLDLKMYEEAFLFDADPNFSTSHDYKVAMIIANEMLIDYLKSEIVALKRKNQSSGKDLIVSKGKYTWTESKAALVELIYSLHASKCINNGNIEIKEIANFLELLLGVDLGDFYHEFLQIKSRQNQTKFIDTLKLALVNRINEQEN